MKKIVFVLAITALSVSCCNKSTCDVTVDSTSVDTVKSVVTVDTVKGLVSADTVSPEKSDSVK